MTVTQDQVINELHRRNYYMATETEYTAAQIPTDTTIKTTPSELPPKEPSFLEKNKTAMMILFAGAFLLTVFPGQGRLKNA